MSLFLIYVRFFVFAKKGSSPAKTPEILPIIASFTFNSALLATDTYIAIPDDCPVSASSSHFHYLLLFFYSYLAS